MQNTDETTKAEGQQVTPAPSPTTGGGTQPTPAVQSSPAAQPETMQIPVDKMQTILDTLAQLQKRDAERDQEMEILRESVSRSRLEEAQGKRKVKGPPKAKLMIYNNKVVIGWKMMKNELVYDPRNLFVPASENLTIRIDFLDGSESVIIPYVEFVRAQERAEVAKVGENGVNWIVKFDDPDVYAEELAIDPIYLNP